jgi:hypothetical protein
MTSEHLRCQAGQSQAQRFPSRMVLYFSLPRTSASTRSSAMTRTVTRPSRRYLAAFSSRVSPEGVERQGFDPRAEVVVFELFEGELFRTPHRPPPEARSPESYPLRRFGRTLPAEVVTGYIAQLDVPAPAVLRSLGDSGRDEVLSGPLHDLARKTRVLLDGRV